MTTAINKANTIFSTINDNFSYLDNKIDNIGGGVSYSAVCPAITISNGVATWNITHNLNSSDVIAILYNSSGQELIKNVSVISDNSLIITFKSSSNVTAGSYKVTIKR